MAKHRDSKGYYRILRVDPDASAEKIQLAFELVEELSDEERGASMSEVGRAYGILMDPEARAVYDQTVTVPERPIRRGGPGRLDDWRVLAACVVLLVGILTFVWLPLYGSRFRSFSAGDRLVDKSGNAFGVVVQTSESHTFSRGTAEGYLIELSQSGEMRWFPAADIKAVCIKAN